MMIAEVRSMLLFLTLLLSVFQSSLCTLQHVTCGSLVKLLNADATVRLHSHDVKYGSGSGQQSVTAVNDQDDSNSYWQVVQAYNTPTCIRGSAVQCGDVVRLLHMNTDKYLHSHLFSAPLTDSHQEVSAYERTDTGDNWKVVCDSDLWRRDGVVKFQHIDTGSFLAITGSQYGRPIKGQYEVAAMKRDSRKCGWRSSEGVFVKESDEPLKYNEQREADEDNEEEHDEL
ncbi:stromal cell-derived factor 2-like [Symsagittifera roscoffensis]|uniref:stromal cell-derived factor 2-like n=1 Tax=Symsagittifera roscoffensis TaxID=84072 RepID=UPI00307B4DF6